MFRKNVRRCVQIENTVVVLNGPLEQFTYDITCECSSRTPNVQWNTSGHGIQVVIYSAVRSGARRQEPRVAGLRALMSWCARCRPSPCRGSVSACPTNGCETCSDWTAIRIWAGSTTCFSRDSAGSFAKYANSPSSIAWTCLRERCSGRVNEPWNPIPAMWTDSAPPTCTRTPSWSGTKTSWSTPTPYVTGSTCKYPSRSSPRASWKPFSMCSGYKGALVSMYYLCTCSHCRRELTLSLATQQQTNLKIQEWRSNVVEFTFMPNAYYVHRRHRV